MPKKIYEKNNLKYFPTVIQNIIWDYCEDQFPLYTFTSTQISHCIVHDNFASIPNILDHMKICGYKRMIKQIYYLLQLYDIIDSENYSIFWFDFNWYISLLLIHTWWRKNIFPHWNIQDGMLICIGTELMQRSDSFLNTTKDYISQKRIHESLFKLVKKYYLKYLNGEKDWVKHIPILKDKISEDIKSFMYQELFERIDYLSIPDSIIERVNRFNVIYPTY